MVWIVLVCLAVAAALGWSRASRPTFRVITEPTPRERRVDLVLRTAAGAVGLALAWAVLPSWLIPQPRNGFRIATAGYVHLLPLFFFWLAASGTLHQAVASMVLGGMVSVDKRRGGQLEARAAGAAESWARRRPRGPVLVFAGFWLACVGCIALLDRREVVGSAEDLRLLGLLDVSVQVVPWSDVEDLAIESSDEASEWRLVWTLRGGEEQIVDTRKVWFVDRDLVARIARHHQQIGVPVRR